MKSERKRRMRRFPLFVSLTRKKVYIAGAGNIALRRIRILLEFDADITVCAPQALPEIRTLAEEGMISYVQRCYREEDLKEAFLVLAATDSREANHMVYTDCRKHGIPVNVSDSRDECDFYFPAVALSDGIVAGITGDGTDHSSVRDTAAKIRRLLQEKE